MMYTNPNRNKSRDAWCSIETYYYMVRLC